MRVPKRNVGPWARELIEECTVSQPMRRENIKLWKNYYLNGTETGDQARYNRCFGHIARLGSMLFSPADVRYDIELDQSEDPNTMGIMSGGTRYLNREFTRCGVNLKFGGGIDWALVKGCTLVKMIWGHDGLEPHLVHPEFFGVLNETITDINHQEAMVHTTWMTKSSFKRTLIEHPERGEILAELDKTMKPRNDDAFTDSYFHEILIGGTNPVSSTAGTASATGTPGQSSVSANVPMLAADVAKELVRVDELWVMDDERQDYTTIRIAEEDIVIEGRYKHRNLLADDANPFLEGEQPFRKIAPNDTDGYFWGMSELTQIAPLQDLLNGQLRDFNRLTTLKADPPRAFIGFSGMTQEKYRTLKRRGGFMSEETPTGKIETLAPDIPPELLQAIDKTLQMFDDVAGFTPVMAGMGEPGVRSNSQAQTLSRNSTPRMRNRALLVEHQCVDIGDLCLKMLQSKKATVFKAEDGAVFTLADLPDDYRMTIDSHTSSPAFSEDSERKAFALARAGAIDHADLIMLTHPPHEDTLVASARKRAAAEAKMIQEHPELLTKGKGKRK